MNTLPAFDLFIEESPTSADSDLAWRKKVFLASLKSTGKLEYKRYLKSPLRYAGGKSLAVYS